MCELQSFVFLVVLLQTIGRIILPKKFGGSEVGVILVNVDHSFDHSDVVRTVDRILSSKNLTASVRSDVCRASLSRLWVVDVFDCASYEICRHRVAEILAPNRNISLIAVDSLTSFYHFFRLESNLFLGRFLHREVGRFSFKGVDLIFTRRVRRHPPFCLNTNPKLGQKV